jgi:hypothetical protein
LRIKNINIRWFFYICTVNMKHGNIWIKFYLCRLKLGWKQLITRKYFPSALSESLNVWKGSDTLLFL